MQCGWVEIRSIRPDQCVDLAVDLDLVEEGQIPKRPKQLARQNGSEIDNPLRSVIKRDAQYVVSNNPEATDTIDRMLHVDSLQRGDRARRLAGLQTVPIRHQFVLMQFGPGLNQATLSPR